MLIDGADFKPVTDYHLVFGPNVNFIIVPINISSDGLFEETELFFVTLSTSIVRLQLNTESANLKKTVCQDRNIFSLFNDTDRRPQGVSIDLDRIVLSQTMDGIILSLATNTSERVSVNPAVTMVTILDSDSKSHICMML